MIKKGLSGFLVTILVVSMASVIVFVNIPLVHAYSFVGGSGTQADPYQIDTIEALYAVRDDLTKSYVLVNDLDFTDDADYDDSSNKTQFITGAGWTPIGDCPYEVSSSFDGNFDGAGYTISNLFINASDAGYGGIGHVGLFGWVGGESQSDAITIENIGLLDVDITVNSTLGGTSCAGSLIGAVQAPGTAQYSYFTTVANCYATGTISGDNRTGGLIGRFKEGWVVNCWSGVNVTGDDMTGGLIGKMSLDTGYGYHYADTLVHNCFANGTVTGGDYVGGLIGYTGALQQDCDAIDSVVDCYAVGNVTGTGDGVAGFIGNVTDGTLSVRNCFYDNQTTTQTSDDNAEGLTTAEMKNYTTFDTYGWIIATTSNATNEVWTIDNGNDYPKLQNVLDFDAEVEAVMWEGGGGLGYTLNYPSQTSVFVAENNVWIFYLNGTDLAHSYSADGSTFTGPVVDVADACEAWNYPSYSVTYDGTYFYASYINVSDVGNELCFIRGDPDTDGSISWDSEQIAVAGSSGVQLHQPDICVDNNGYYYVAYSSNSTGDQLPYITKCESQNDTWATASGFPYNGTDTAPEQGGSTIYRASVVNATGGVLFAWFSYLGELSGRFYNGTWSDLDGIGVYSEDSITFSMSGLRGDYVDVAFKGNETSDLMYAVYDVSNFCWDEQTTMFEDFQNPSAQILVDSSTEDVYYIIKMLPTDWYYYYMRLRNGEWSAVTRWFDTDKDFDLYNYGWNTVFDGKNGVVVVDMRGYMTVDELNLTSTALTTLDLGGDTVAPTYSDLSTNATDAGSVCDFGATFDDDTDLTTSGAYIFSTNNTGTWANETAVIFTSTPETANVSKTLNSTVGMVVGYQWFFNDTAGNDNSTGIQTLVITDGTLPTYSSLSTSTTVAGSTCYFNATFNDETALPSNGQYLFATNNTGSWVWDSAVNFTSTPENIAVQKTLNSTVGMVVGYRWNVTDNAGNLNYTAISAITLTDGTVPTYSGVTHSATEYGTSCNFTITVNDETALNPNGQYLFATNNTGAWVWESAVNFTSTPENLTVTKTLNSTVGMVVGYRWNITDNVGNANYTAISTLTITDTTAPTYSSISNSTSQAGTACYFNITINDGSALESNGQYLFATNNTGTWVWDSAVNFTSTPENVAVQKTLNSTVGLVIGYRWNITDNAGNANYTDIQTLTTIDTTASTYSSVTNSTSEAGTTCYFNITVNDNSVLNPNGQYQFATNNTGTWVWDSAVNFTSTPETVSVSKTLNSTAGLVIGYRWNITDNLGNANATDISTITIEDTTAPTVSGVSHSNTAPEASTTFEATLTDVNGLVGGGWIFSQNITGSWTNSTYTAFSSNPETVQSIEELGDESDVVVGYCWYYNDTLGNWGTSSVYTLTTGDVPAGGGGGGGGGDNEDFGEDDDLPDESDPNYSGASGTGVINLPELIDNIVEQIRQIPPMALWAIVGVLGLVMVVAGLNQSVGKKIDKFGRVPQRKLEKYSKKLKR